VPYWAAARLAPRQETLALHCLALAGYSTYLPRVREHRVSRGRRILATPPLFPGYCFITIELQWHAARWAPGTRGLIMDGMQPARVPDSVIAEIQSRERDGFVVLPKAPRLRQGAQVRVVHGAFQGHLGIYAGMNGRQRVAVLLTLFGALRPVTMAQGDVEPV
jgi:transcriptional antiterminator RfaH